MADGTPSRTKRQSYLTSLVREKKAVNKYVDRMRDKIPPNGNATKKPIDKEAYAQTEEGGMKSINSRSSIASSAVSSAEDMNSEKIDDRGELALTDVQKEVAEKASKGILLLKEAFKDYSHLIKKFPVEVRMEKLFFSVPYTESSTKITTVYNSSILYKGIKLIKNLTNMAKEPRFEKATYTKQVLEDISLYLKPGKM